MMAEESAPALERGVAWIARQPVVPITLVWTVGACLVYSLSDAHWVVTNTSYVNAIWLGLLCGAALARSRFRSLTALAYTVCLSLLCAGEWVGGIMRPVWAGRADILWAMSVRMEALLLRLRSWGAALANRSAIHDTGLFVFLSVFVLWNAGVWLVWTLVRRRRVWEGLLPAAALLAVNIHLSGQKPLLLSVFIVAGGLLAAYVPYVDHHADWDKRQVDYPDEMWIAWGGGAAVIAVIIALAAQGAVWVGTPAGWHAIGDVWISAQRQAADVASRLFADVNPPRVQAPPPAAPGSGAQSSVPAQLDVASAALPPDLRLIGNVPDQSPAIVMWVQTSDPAPYPPDVADRTRRTSPPQHYWRTGIFTTYNGSGWEPLDFSAEGETTGPEIQPRGRYRLLQHFEILASHGNNLFAANLPLTVTAGAQVQFSRLGDSATVTGAVSDYQTLSWVSQASASQLNSAGTDYPPEIASTYLQWPDTLPQRVRALADRITAAAATPYEKAQLIQEYLRSNLTYTLRVPPPPAGQDAVDYFLFEAPGGYCSYYASAMAVMLRVEGVPARVVTGYAMGDYDFQRAAYSVPGASAHAWVEVYFPTYGWVEFEPTASRSEFDRSSQAPQVPPVPTQALPSLNEVKFLGLIPWGYLVSGLALVLLGMGVVRAYRGLEPGWNTPRGRARAVYRQMRAALAGAGLHAPEHLTPDEFRAACERPLANYPALALALGEATRLYVRATFSGRAPNPSETRRVGRLWLRALGERLRLWWQANLAGVRQSRPRPKPRRSTRTRV